MKAIHASLLLSLALFAPSPSPTLAYTYQQRYHNLHPATTSSPEVLEEAVEQALEQEQKSVNQYLNGLLNTLGGYGVPEEVQEAAEEQVEQVQEAYEQAGEYVQDVMENVINAIYGPENDTSAEDDDTTSVSPQGHDDEAYQYLTTTAAAQQEDDEEDQSHITSVAPQNNENNDQSRYVTATVSFTVPIEDDDESSNEEVYTTVAPVATTEEEDDTDEVTPVAPATSTENEDDDEATTTAPVESTEEDDESDEDGITTVSPASTTEEEESEVESDESDEMSTITPATSSEEESENEYVVTTLAPATSTDDDVSETDDDTIYTTPATIDDEESVEDDETVNDDTVVDAESVEDDESVDDDVTTTTAPVTTTEPADDTTTVIVRTLSTVDVTTQPATTTVDDDDDDDDDDATTVAPVPTTTVPNLCTDCDFKHGVGYNPHPTDCTLFVQCRMGVDGVPVVSGVKSCPHGLYWNQDKLTCDFQANVQCVDDICRSNSYKKKKRSGATCRGFWDCESGTAIARCCAPGFAYNAALNTCVYDLACQDDCLDSTNHVDFECHNMRPVPGNRNAYLVKTGDNSWTQMSCPPTLAFTEYPCGCSVPLHPAKQTVCYPELYMPFIKDLKDHSGNHLWVHNEGVSLKHKGAFFDGNSRLIIPRFSWWGSTVYVHVRYLSQGYPSNSRYALVSNGDCQERPSMGMCSGPQGVDFYAETKDSEMPANFTVPFGNYQGGFQEALYSLDGGYLTGYTPHSYHSVKAKGFLESRPRGLVVGSGGGCQGFEGYIQELTVYLCRPYAK